MFGKLSYAVSALLVASSVLPALSAPTAADSLLGLAKRIVIPACSGDPNTPKPAFCSQFDHPINFQPGGPVSFKREDAAWELAKRIVIPACSGDPNTPKPAFCEQFNHPTNLGIPGAVEFKREDNNYQLAKRFAICAKSLLGGSSEGCTPNGIPGFGPLIYRREDEMMDLAKRIIIPACSGDPNTPKPAFCSTLSKTFPTSINGHQILALRDTVMDALSKRFAPLCTGSQDGAAKPAFCSKVPIGLGPVVGNGNGPFRVGGATVNF